MKTICLLAAAFILTIIYAYKSPVNNIQETGFEICALSEMSVEEDMALYPNPATTSMTISLPEDMQENQVTVLSDQGEVITTFTNNKTMLTINTGKLGRGNYFLSVADKKKKLTKRFSVE